MRVKRLKLSGFKSFVEPAELRIEPGLTGIVGPNGCGKSNVLEAIRWVMGESSPKSMRGSGMEDVIFAGTSMRPARDFAEVSMLVEREQGDLNGDSTIAPAGELEITRRIERGAGSAYRMNGRDVRAKDVALLFADAATGAHSPALVSQGRISAVIAARPTERRLLLEEAAGISGLHVRRKDAETKLRAAEANLARIDEMLSEMEQRSLALKRQTRSAERYRRYSDQIVEAEARLLFARWREAATAAEAAREEAAQATRLVEQSGEAQRQAAARQKDAATALHQSRRAAEAAREHASELGHKSAALRAERESIRRRIAELAERKTTLAADQARESTLRTDAASALERLDGELKAIAARRESAEARRRMIEAEVETAEAEAKKAETELAQARSVQAAQQAEARIVQSEIAAARGRLERAEREAERLAGQLASLAEALPLETALAAAADARAKAEGEMEQAGARIAGAETERQQAAARRDEAESRMAAARAALAALESEARALLEAVGQGGGDRAINHVQARPGYERALAAALGDDLDAALDGESPRRWTRGEVQPGDPPLPAGCAALADHVSAPPALKRRLAQIAIIEQDDGSVPLAVGQRLVTLDGRLRRWDGFVAEGVGAAAAERLIRVNRLAEIESELPRAADRTRAAQQGIDEARRAVDGARAAADEARRAEAAAAEAIRAAKREEDRISVELERIGLRRGDMAERGEALASERREAEAALAAAREAETRLPDEKATDATVEALRASAETALKTLADARASLAGHERLLLSDRERLEAAQREKADWEARAGDALRRGREIDERIEAARAEEERLAQAPADLDERLAEAAAQSALAAEAAAEAAREEEAAAARVAAAEQEVAQAAEMLASARERRAGAVARAEHQEIRRAELERIAAEKFECAPEALPERTGIDPASVMEAGLESARLEKLNQDRERLGPVNLIAESELGELEESRALSQAEREELGVAINRLRGSIGSLNREGRVRLLTAFQEVDRHFRSLFTTLFEGGQAHLELVESDDPLEAGLEIMAQPPGKRLATLTLLSGGEQALTAIALIFALFLTNPAPICVLDEVDAPLDDANIERFCSLLDRMVSETDTRYLIVTHNAVTMSRMHRLFGVTMIEKGISRLVSVDLGGAESLLAAE